MSCAAGKLRTPRNSSNAVEEQLARYRAMRNFNVTAEPKGGLSKTAKNREKKKFEELPFVIQKHAATRLHYDFRLGWRGVLKSWAVTKGPSYYPGDKRLAVQVEDHPIEYGGFEGIIPKGQYGGGTVMVWDQGTWTPHGDVDEGLSKGRLKFTLHGTKLKGDWALIRMGGKAAEERKPNWLLIKEHDKYERTATDPPVTEEQPDSVVTARGLDAIAEHQDHVWGTHGSSKEEKGAAPAKALSKKQSGSKTTQHPVRNHKLAQATRLSSNLDFASELRNAPKERLPEFVPPQLALQVKEAPVGPEWIHELKLDGYRIQGRLDGSKHPASAPVALLTRSGLDWTRRMPDIAEGLAKLPATSALFDGEVVVLDKKGATSFALLQAAFQKESKQELTYFVFDLLYLNGHNLCGLPLDQRKQILQELLTVSERPERGRERDPGIIRFSEHLWMSGKEVFAKACQLGAEGIVSKKISAPYSSGRNGAWLKVKCARQQEFVIGGFTLPSKRGVGIGALLLGYYSHGKLMYAGRTGTGFTQKMRQTMRATLERIRQAHAPFAPLPPGASRDAVWVQPKLVCEVGFATWTADNLVRQAAFKGLREDKPAKEITREAPVEFDNAPTSKKKQAETAHAALRLRAKLKPKQSSSVAEDFPISLTHPEKQVDAKSKLTKRELADYFWAVRDHILPHISNRPLSIVRCPAGSTQPCFFQKHVTGNLPEGIDGIEVRGRKSGVVETYITLSKSLALAGLAQMGVLEIHPWGSSNIDIEKPDRLIFDLDPDEDIGWKTLAESAREVRARLRECKLESFLKTTGGKGLHVVAPIRPEYEWPVVKKFALAIASRMESDNKRLYLIKMTKAARAGKIFIDYLRNDRGATSVAPYSPRARSGAPVAAPLDWKELDGPKVPRFPVADFADWQARLRHDPWKAMLTKRQSIPAEILKRFGIVS